MDLRIWKHWASWRTKPNVSTEKTLTSKCGKPYGTVPKKQAVNGLVPFFNSTNSCRLDIHEKKRRKRTSSNRDTSRKKIPLVKTTPHIDERLVGDEQSIKWVVSGALLNSSPETQRRYAVCSSSFPHGHKTDALVDSRAYTRAIAQNGSDTIKQQALANIFEFQSSKFQTELAKIYWESNCNSHTEIWYWRQNFFVVMKSLTAPFIGLQFVRHNRVVNDTEHGLNHSPHLTMQIKSAAGEQVLNRNLFPLATPWHNYPEKWKYAEPLLIILQNGTQQVLWHQWKNSLKQQVCWFLTHCQRFFDKKWAVTVTNTTQSHCLIRKNTRIAQISVVTPQQSKLPKLSKAVLNKIPEVDQDLITYLNESLKKWTNQNSQTTHSGFRRQKTLLNWGSYPNTKTKP